jgi:hypothetical protein
MLRIGAILIAVLMFPSGAKAEMSAAKFIDLYKKANAQDRQYLEEIARAEENGMEWNGTMAHVRLYCSPPNMAFTGSQIIDILERVGNEHRYIQEQPYGIAILAALEIMFPCKENSN